MTENGLRKSARARKAPSTLYDAALAPVAKRPATSNGGGGASPRFQRRGARAAGASPAASLGRSAWPDSPAAGNGNAGGGLPRKSGVPLFFGRTQQQIEQEEIRQQQQQQFLFPSGWGAAAPAAATLATDTASCDNAAAAVAASLASYPCLSLPLASTSSMMRRSASPATSLLSGLSPPPAAGTAGARPPGARLSPLPADGKYARGAEGSISDDEEDGWPTPRAAAAAKAEAAATAAFAAAAENSSGGTTAATTTTTGTAAATAMMTPPPPQLPLPALALRRAPSVPQLVYSPRVPATTEDGGSASLLVGQQQEKRRGGEAAARGGGEKTDLFRLDDGGAALRAFARQAPPPLAADSTVSTMDRAAFGTAPWQQQQMQQIAAAGNKGVAAVALGDFDARNTSIESVSSERLRASLRAGLAAAAAAAAGKGGANSNGSSRASSPAAAAGHSRAAPSRNAVGVFPPPPSPAPFPPSFPMQVAEIDAALPFNIGGEQGGDGDAGPTLRARLELLQRWIAGVEEAERVLTAAGVGRFGARGGGGSGGGRVGEVARAAGHAAAAASCLADRRASSRERSASVGDLGAIAVADDEEIPPLRSTVFDANAHLGRFNSA
jgi:hypothetical protein